MELAMRVSTWRRAEDIKASKSLDMPVEKDRKRHATFNNSSISLSSHTFKSVILILLSL